MTVNKQCGKFLKFCGKWLLIKHSPGLYKLAMVVKYKYDLIDTLSADDTPNHGGLHYVASALNLILFNFTTELFLSNRRCMKFKNLV